MFFPPDTSSVRKCKYVHLKKVLKMMQSKFYSSVRYNPVINLGIKIIYTLHYTYLSFAIAPHFLSNEEYGVIWTRYGPGKIKLKIDIKGATNVHMCIHTYMKNV